MAVSDGYPSITLRGAAGQLIFCVSMCLISIRPTEPIWSDAAGLMQRYRLLFSESGRDVRSAVVFSGLVHADFGGGA